jgi:hypothetical protein
MSDLDAAIRAKLDDPKQYAENGNGPLIAGLLAVLEMYRRIDEDWTHISENAYEAGRRWALEQAVAEIAEALGIEAE